MKRHNALMYMCIAFVNEGALKGRFFFEVYLLTCACHLVP